MFIYKLILCSTPLQSDSNTVVYRTDKIAIPVKLSSQYCLLNNQLKVSGKNYEERERVLPTLNWD